MGYREIADEVRARILDGRLNPGALAPPVREFAKTNPGWGSSAAAQRAYALLVAQGVLAPEHGVGHRVTPDAKQAAQVAPGRLDRQTAGEWRADVERRIHALEQGLAELKHRLK